MKTFILMSAIAGSGKSTWAENYKKAHDNVHIISSDALRKEIGGHYQNFNNEEVVWARFAGDILKFLDSKEDVTVIADATNITNGHRKHYAEIAKDFDKKILVVFKRDLENVMKKNKERNADKIVPDAAILDMWNRWEDVDEETKKMFDEVIEIDNWFSNEYR